MIKEIFHRLTIGVALGGIATFIALTVMMLNHIEASVSTIWLNMVGGMLIGIYYALSSFIFMPSTWSDLKKTTIHFSTSVIVYYLIALPLGWVPFTFLAMIISLILFVVIYAIYWTGFYLYFKKVADTLNEELKNYK
mgnify:CR=1 FL=1